MAPFWNLASAGFRTTRRARLFSLAHYHRERNHQDLGNELIEDAWTVRGLVTYYTLFAIELESRRIRIIGSTPHPDDAFMPQIVRELLRSGSCVRSRRNAWTA